MPRHLLTHAERPDLAEIDFDVWAAYNTHGDVLNRYWRRLYKNFPEFQFVHRRRVGGLDGDGLSGER